MFSAYTDQGYSIIPIAPRTKIAKENWEKFQHQVPNKEIVARWERDLKGHGLALCTGAVSGIDVVDIDTDHPLTHELSPKSGLSRVGRPGRIQYFFKHNPSLQSMTDRERKIEYLSTGRYTVLPPSIHPDTGEPYEWVGELSLPGTTPDELPMLANLDWIKSCPIIEAKGNLEFSGGRNNYLKDMICAAVMKGKTDHDIALEIYLEDMKKHKPRLFLDSKEQFRATNEEEAKLSALRMVLSVKESLIRSKVLVEFPKENIFSIDSITEDSKFKPLPYPKASGIVNEFIQLANESSSNDVTDIALGGALSLMSALCANRFVVDHRRLTPSNIYIFLIGRSALGKNVPLEIAGNLCSLVNLSGASDWASTVGIYKGLSKKQQRLDIIDECGEVFRRIREGEGNFAGSYELLNKLYSSSMTEYRGDAISSEETLHRGRVRNPSLSILGATTKKAFERAIDERMVFDGFFGRSGIFIQNVLQRNPYPKDWTESQRLRDLQDFVRMFTELYPIEHKDSMGALIDIEAEEWGRWVRFRRLKLTEEAAAILDLFETECSEKYIKTNEDDPLSAFIGRRGEIARRFAMFHNRGRTDGLIDVEDVSWAIETVRVMQHNSRPFFKYGLAETKIGVLQNKIMAHLASKGGSETEGKLRHRFKHYSDHEYFMNLELLEKIDLIMKVTEIRKNSKCSVIRLTGHDEQTFDD